MELSVMSPVLNQMGLDEALGYLHSLGVDSLEIGNCIIEGNHYL